MGASDRRRLPATLENAPPLQVCQCDGFSVPTTAAPSSSSLLLAAVRHLQPVEFFLDAMEGVVADVSSARIARTARRDASSARSQQGVGTSLVDPPPPPLRGRQTSAESSRRTESAADEASPSSTESAASSIRARAALDSWPTGSPSCRFNDRNKGFNVSPWMVSVPSTTRTR